MAEPEDIKAVRQTLRRIHEHLLTAHLALGAQEIHGSAVDVIYHPNNPIPDLNYATPRRMTAWVSGTHVAWGLEHLRTLNRLPRVLYIEGLFLPVFASTLRDLGLSPERETPLMVYQTDQPLNASPTNGYTLAPVSDQRGIELWWYVWRNAHYDVVTLGVEPLVVGRDMAAIRLGTQIDLLAQEHGFPVGVARVEISSEHKTAHIVATALMREARTPELRRALLNAAAQAAVERGCTLVFTAGETDEDRALCRSLGFLDFGAVLCYAETRKDEAPHDRLAQPLLTLR